MRVLGGVEQFFSEHDEVSVSFKSNLVKSKNGGYGGGDYRVFLQAVSHGSVSHLMRECIYKSKPV